MKNGGSWKKQSLYRVFGEVSLVIEKRKPFYELAKRSGIQLSLSDKI